MLVSSGPRQEASVVLQVPWHEAALGNKDALQCGSQAPQQTPGSLKDGTDPDAPAAEHSQLTS